MTFATDTCATASRWCSPRMTSSAVWPSAARCASSPLADGGEARPVLAHALEELHDEGGLEGAGQRGSGALPLRVDPRHVPVGGAPGGAGGEGLVREPRRFSTSASFSMLGHAQSSPMVSGATVWKASSQRTSCGRSRRLSLCRMSSTASA